MDLLDMMDRKDLEKYNYPLIILEFEKRNSYKYNAIRLKNTLLRYKKRRKNEYWLGEKTKECIEHLYKTYKAHGPYLNKGGWFEKELNKHYIYIEWIRDNDDELIKYSSESGKKRNARKMFEGLHNQYI